MAILVETTPSPTLSDIGRAFNRESLLIVSGDIKTLRKEHPEKYQLMPPAMFKVLMHKKAAEQADILALHDPELKKIVKAYVKINPTDAEAVETNIKFSLSNPAVKKEIDLLNKIQSNARSYIRLEAEWAPWEALKDVGAVFVGVGALVVLGPFALLTACGGENPNVKQIPPDNSPVPVPFSPPYSAVIPTKTQLLQVTTANFGPTGGQVSDIVIDPFKPDHLLSAAYQGGIFESNDGGNHWSFSSNGLNDLRILSVSFDPNNQGIAYALGSTGLLKRVGNGNWNLVSAQLSISTSQFGGAFPLIFNGDDVLVVTPTNIGYSNDRGLHWAISKNPANLSGAGLYSRIGAAFTDKYIYLATDNGVYQSSDKTKSWMKLNTFETSYTAIGVSNDGTVYIGTDSGNISKSTDDGKSWKGFLPPQEGYHIRSIAVNPNDSNELYVGGAYGGLYHYSGYWQNLFDVYKADETVFGDDIRNLTMDWKNNLLYVAADQGVYTFDSMKNTFALKNQGLTNTLAYGISLGKSGDIYLAMQDTGIFIYHGNSWKNLGFGDAGCVVESKNYPYLWSRFPSNGILYRSKPGDQNYVEFDNLKSSATLDAGRDTMVYDDAGNLYISSTNGISKTNDEGQSFSLLSQKSADKLFFDQISRKLYSTTVSWGPLRELELYSVDINSGKTTSIKTFESSINSFSINGNSMLVATDNGVYASDDAGLTWRKTNLPADGNKTVTINPNSPNQYFAAYSSDHVSNTPIYGKGLYFSNDSGKTWQPVINDDLTRNSITGFVFDPNSTDIYVSTFSRGVFKFNLPTQ